MNLVVRPGGHAWICQSKCLHWIYSTHAAPGPTAGCVGCQSPAFRGVEWNGGGIAKQKKVSPVRRSALLVEVLFSEEYHLPLSPESAAWSMERKWRIVLPLYCAFIKLALRHKSSCAFKASQCFALCLGFVHAFPHGLDWDFRLHWEILWWRGLIWCGFFLKPTTPALDLILSFVNTGTLTEA